MPRIRPPFPAVAGAYQSPTVLNNVETFCSVPPIILQGGAYFAGLGTPKNGGTRLFCLSGHINKPGVYELPMGFNLMRMINEVGGGMRNGKKLKAVIPGGSSCPVLKADECDLAMDFDTLAAAKSMLGSGGVVVMDEDTCMVKAALRIMRFYAHESCGWCIPCREGTTWLRKLLTRFHEGMGQRSDIVLIGDLARNMLGRTFCPLGDAAALPTISIVEKFEEEFEAHLNGEPCPYEKSSRLVAHRASMADLVKFTIDGRELEAPAGTLVIEAAKRAGIEIPSFCYYEGYSLQAACRMCLVEVEKMPKMQVACTLPVGNGMVVHTDSAQVRTARKSTLEFLLDQSPARLPGLRQGRRVRTAGHGVPLRRGREPLHRNQDARRRAAVVARRFLRRPALHSLLPLRSRLRRRHGRGRARRCQPRRRFADRAERRRSSRTATNAASASISARSAR